MPVPVFPHILDRVGHQSLRAGEGHPGLAVVAGNTGGLGVKAEPQVSPRVCIQTLYRVVSQAVGGGEVGALRPIIPHHPFCVPIAKPQRALRVFHHGPHRPIGQGLQRGECRAIVATDAAEGADPQRALPIFQNGHHQIVRQAIGRGEVGKSTLLVAASPRYGAKPQIAPLIRLYGAHLVVGQAVGGSVGRPVGAVEAADPIGAGAKPQVTVKVGDHSQDLLSLQGGHRRQTGPVPAMGPFVGADPQLALPIFGQGQDRVADQPVGGGIGRPFLTVVAAQTRSSRVIISMAATDPQLALAILQEGAHLIGGQAIGGGKGVPFLAIEATKAPPSSAAPYMPLAILQKRPRLIGSQTVGGGKGVPFLAIEATDAFLSSADPQLALAILQEGAHPIGGQAIGGGKAGEVAPVEATDAPSYRAEPQLTGPVAPNRSNKIGASRS